MYAFVVVIVDRHRNAFVQFSQTFESAGCSKFVFQCAVEPFFEPVLPRAALVTAGECNLHLLAQIPQPVAQVFTTLVAVQDGR